MSLTSTQLTTLKTAIQNNATANAYLLAGDTVSLLAWCNAAASPVQAAWRIAVPPNDLDDAADYTTFDGLTQGKRDEWSIFLRYAPRDMSRNAKRKVVTDVWGNATAGSVAEAVLQASTENATNAQVALGGTTATTGTVTALRRSFSGLVDQTDANKLVNL